MKNHKSPPRIFTRGSLQLLIVAFLDLTSISFIFPILPTLSAATGTLPGQWVWVAVVNAAILSIGPFIWGSVINDKNYRLVIFGTMIVKCLCFVWLAFFTHTFIMLLVNRAVSGAMSGTSLAIRIKLVDSESNSEGKAKGISSLNISMGLGATAGSLIGGIVVDLGQHMVWVLPTALVIFALSNLGAVFTEIPRTSKSHAKPVDPGTAQHDLPATTPPVQPLRHYTPSIVTAMVAAIVIRLVTSIIPIVLLLLGEEGDLIALRTSSFVIAAMSIAGIPLQLFTPLIVKKVKLPLAIFVALGLVSLSLVVPSLWVNLLTVVISSLLVSALGGILQSLLVVYLTNEDKDSVPILLGAHQGLTNIAGTIAPAAAGLLFAYTHSRLFLILAFTLVPLLPLVWLRLKDNTLT